MVTQTRPAVHRPDGLWTRARRSRHGSIGAGLPGAESLRWGFNSVTQLTRPRPGADPGALLPLEPTRTSWPYLLLVVVVGLFVSGMRSVAIDRMSDFGLISVLPWQVLASVGLLTVGAILVLRAERPSAIVMTLYLVTLVFMLYAIPVIVEQVARFSVNWVHEGFIEYVRRTGSVAPQLEARFDWPGFFILVAFLSQAAGMGSTVDWANWAPVCFNLLYLPALVAIFRSFTHDPRLIWAGLWLFALGNWIGQDYFSPQALAYFLDLAILGAVLTWFRVARPRSDRVAAELQRLGHGAGRWAVRIYDLITPEDEPPAAASWWQLAGLLSATVGIFAFIAYSHQLTPFFLSFAVLGLVVLNRLSARSLPVIFGVITVAWVSYMTVPFLQGHVASLLNEVGRLGDTVGTNVVSRIQGSPDHQTIVTIRLAFTLVVWAAAGLGAIVRFRDGRRDLSVVVLVLAPVPLIALQAYGGELVLRLYLFTLPMAAFLAAGIVYGRAGPAPSRRMQGFVAMMSMILIVTFFVTRYGNERADVMTSAEVQAVNQLYAMAPAGSLLLAASNNLPWKSKDFERYTYLPTADVSYAGNVPALATLLGDPTYPAAFLILTRSQGNYAEVFNNLRRGGWDDFVAKVRASPQFREVYRNADADIFVPAAQATAVLTP